MYREIGIPTIERGNYLEKSLHRGHRIGHISCGQWNQIMSILKERLKVDAEKATFLFPVTQTWELPLSPAL